MKPENVIDTDEAVDVPENAIKHAYAEPRAVGVGNTFQAPKGIFAAPPSSASTPASAPTGLAGVNAVRAAKAPKIDGKLDDEVWKSAKFLDHFTMTEPTAGEPPSEHTSFAVAYNNDGLYFAIRCDDTEPDKIMKRLTRRDRFVSGADSVYVEIDSLGEKRVAHGFFVYASGQQIDWRRTGDDAYDNDWDAVWNSATLIDSGGWSAEIFVPFSALRISHPDTVPIRLQVGRAIARKLEGVAWIYRPPTEPGALNYMGDIRGLTDISHPFGFELRPFVLGQLTHQFSPPGFDPPSSLKPGYGVGGEFALRPSASLVIDGAILPDFSQVEADQVILNLSTFELFFPEKRQFFQSGANLFNLQDNRGTVLTNQLFYSRRIGAAPPDAVVNPGERVVNQPLKNDIWGAAKLTGKISDHVSIAMLDATSSNENATVQGTDGKTQLTRGVAPISNFAVARIESTLPHGFTLGVMGTGVDRFEQHLASAGNCPNDPNDTLTPTTAARNGRCSSDAYSGAVDASWTSPAGSYLAAATVLSSLRLNGPDKWIPDGYILRSGNAGYGAIASFSKANGNFVFDLNYEGYSPKVDLNDAGYLQQQNLHTFYGRALYRTLQPLGPTFQTATGIELNQKLSYDGVRLSNSADIFNIIYWKNFWSTNVTAFIYPSAYDNRETRDGAYYQRPLYWGGSFSLQTDDSKMIGFNTQERASNTLRGYHVTASVSAELRLFNRLELSIGPSIDWSSGDPRWVSTAQQADGLRTYQFGDLDARADSIISRLTFTFTPKISFQAYGQFFVATEHYGPFYNATAGGQRTMIALSSLKRAGSASANPDVQDAALNLNAVLRWEYLPGSTLFVIYTRAQGIGNLTNGVDPNTPDVRAFARGPSTDVFLVKLSYWYGR